MREHLIQYVDLLFAGAANAWDMKQEILQNTLDRYDDLISQGKTPEAAYQLAIAGIGDIREILGSTPAAAVPTAAEAPVIPGKKEKPIWKKVLQALSICLYILSPLPLFLLQNEIGLCGLLAICAAATGLIILAGSSESPSESGTRQKKQESELNKALGGALTALCLCVYFAVSFLTGAWYITWLIFPIFAAIKGLIKACLDLKEAQKHEA